MDGLYHRPWGIIQTSQTTFPLLESLTAKNILTNSNTKY